MTNSDKQKAKIYTEGTPNPNALKFVVNKVLLETGTANFPNKESSNNSPLAKSLFEIDSVQEVFIGKDFITVSKTPDTTWETIYNKIFDVINKHFESGEVTVLQAINTISKKEPGSSEVIDKILDILDNQIRPAVASDGGDVIFDSYENGILRLHLQGSCSHCPSSIMTLKAGIEAMLKRQIPELQEVVSV